MKSNWRGHKSLRIASGIDFTEENPSERQQDDQHEEVDHRMTNDRTPVTLKPTLHRARSVAPCAVTHRSDCHASRPPQSHGGKIRMRNTLTTIGTRRRNHTHGQRRASEDDQPAQASSSLQIQSTGDVVGIIDGPSLAFTVPLRRTALSSQRFCCPSACGDPRRGSATHAVWGPPICSAH